MTSSLAQTLFLVGAISVVPLGAMALMARQNTPATWFARLVPVAAGSLFSGAVLHLIPEAIEQLGGAWLTIGLAMGGFVVFWRIDRALHRTSSPAHGMSLGAHTRGTATLDRGLATTAMLGDSIHNIVDGMLIAAALLDGPALGIVAALAIAVHEMPRELGTFSVLVRSGMSARNALLFNAMTAVLALSGATTVYMIGQRAATATIWLLPIAAGNFVYLAASLTLSEYRASTRAGDGLQRLALFLAGAAVTALGIFWHP